MEGNGTPLQYSHLENPMEGGARWAAIPGVAKSETRPSDFTFSFHLQALEKEVATHYSVLAWRIPGMGEPGRLPSMGLHRVRHDWSNLAAATASLKTWTTALSNSMKLSHALCSHPRQRGHGGEVWQNVVHCRREWQATSVFLLWECHEQYEKAKRWDPERWTPQVGRCLICYWR